MYRKHVSSRDVALNPVAQAIARTKLKHAIRNQKIKMYLMDDGEACEEFCVGVGMTLALIGYAAELDRFNDTPEHRVLRGGLSACQQMAKTGRWEKINTTSIVQALDAAEVLRTQIKPDSINRAWHELSKGPPSESQQH